MFAYQSNYLPLSTYRDHMVVGFTTTISAYHRKSCEFEPCSLHGVLDTTLCDKVFQLLAPPLEKEKSIVLKVLIQ